MENDDIESRLARIEAALERLTAAVSSHEGTDLVAPVRVYSPQGALLAEFSAETNDLSLRLYNREGIPVASLGIDGAEAGYLAIRNSQGFLIGYLNVENSGARLLLHDQRQIGGVALFGADADGEGGGLNLLSSAGDIAADLWAERNGGKLRLYRCLPADLVVELPTPDSALRDDAEEKTS